MAKEKEEDLKPNDGLLYYIMDQHMWVFTIFLVPISLVYDIYFKIYLTINLWRDRHKVIKQMEKQKVVVRRRLSSGKYVMKRIK